VNTSVNTPGRVAALRPLMRRRRIKLALCAAALTAIVSTTMSGSLAAAATRSHQAPAVVPVATVVGTGLVSCKTVTGEVGYSPNSVAGGKGTLTVSIWFRGTHCQAATSTTKPVPKWVIGSMSFTTPNRCPLLSIPSGTPLGAGTLNLAYNYPDVAPLLIDPSVAPKVTVTQFGPYWILAGPVISGSYPDPTFKVLLKPNPFAGQSCSPPGFTSEYIARSQGPLTV
jgi:hypothetical protein